MEMATTNPLEDILSREIDESAVHALVGSLESRLASPTHKEASQQNAESAVNNNHINSHAPSDSSASRNSPFNHVPGINITHGPTTLTHDNISHINNVSISSTKSLQSYSQIMGINSIMNSSSPANSGGVSVVNSCGPNRISDPGKMGSTPSIRIITQTRPSSNSPVITLPGGNVKSFTNPVSVSNVNATSTGVNNSRAMFDLANIASEQKPITIPPGQVNQVKVVQNMSAVMVQDQINNQKEKTGVGTVMSGLGPNQFIIKRESPTMHIKQEVPQFMKQEGSIVKSEMPNVKRMQGSPDINVMHLGSNPNLLQQATNVHIVNAKPNATNSNVITLSRTQPQTVTVVRPPLNTTSAGGTPRHVFSSSIQQTPAGQIRLSAPIRSATQQQSQQVSIAPRPGGPTNTITLHPSVQLSAGTVLMRNEQGQIVIVSTGQPGGIQQQGQTTVSGPASTTYKIQNVKSQPRPTTSSSIITLPAPGSAPGGTPHLIQHPPGLPVPPHSAATMPASNPSVMHTIIRNAAPNVPPQHNLPVISTAANQKGMLENVQKCKNFLSTLIKLASNQPEKTVQNVRELIQGLIDGKVEPETFTEKLQIELKSSPQPYLVPFLKKSLPLLRQSLIMNKMTIDGVRAPPPQVLNLQTAPMQPSTISPAMRQPMHPAATHVHTTTGQFQVRHQGKLLPTPMPMTGMHVDPLRRMMPKGTIAGALPTTVTALQAHMVSGSKHDTANMHKDKRKFESLKDDDDINDVATMGGVNLTEESKNILATNADFIGTQIRSCKDENFLYHGPLLNKISAIARKYGINDVSGDTVNIISHAAQERLRDIVEKLSTIAEHRIEIYKMDSRYEVTKDVKSQLKFLEELDRLEKKRHEEQEREVLLKAAKSRSKHEDPEQQKLKQKAKELQQAEMEEMRHREANLTALAAIGPRKKRKMETEPSQGGSGTSSTANGVLRPRIKRVNLRDLIFLMEQERSTSKSITIYKSFLK